MEVTIYSYEDIKPLIELVSTRGVYLLDMEANMITYQLSRAHIHSRPSDKENTYKKTEYINELGKIIPIVLMKISSRKYHHLGNKILACSRMEYGLLDDTVLVAILGFGSTPFVIASASTLWSSLQQTAFN